jgi:trimethylamine--corrinoid protein Co-methyltransferase
MMSEADVVTKRRGGRTARKELRAAPIPEAERPVKPGMEGGKSSGFTKRR